MVPTIRLHLGIIVSATWGEDRVSCVILLVAFSGSVPWDRKMESFQQLGWRTVFRPGLGVPRYSLDLSLSGDLSSSRTPRTAHTQLFLDFGAWPITRLRTRLAFGTNLSNTYILHSTYIHTPSPWLTINRYNVTWRNPEKMVSLQTPKTTDEYIPSRVPGRG